MKDCCPRLYWQFPIMSMPYHLLHKNCNSTPLGMTKSTPLGMIRYRRVPQRVPPPFCLHLLVANYNERLLAFIIYEHALSVNCTFKLVDIY